MPVPDHLTVKSLFRVPAFFMEVAFFITPIKLKRLSFQVNFADASFHRPTISVFLATSLNVILWAATTRNEVQGNEQDLALGEAGETIDSRDR